MTKRENEILTRLAQIIPKLPENKQERILGVAEGMSAMKEEFEARKAGQEKKECGFPERDSETQRKELLTSKWQFEASKKKLLLIGKAAQNQM